MEKAKQFGKIKYLIIFFTSLIILYLRRPDVLVNAQFWAEDGWAWYAEMHNLGIASLFHPMNGYFQTISRLTMLITLPFGIINAPLVSNLVSLIIRSFLVVFFFSKRFSSIPIYYRLVVSLFYLLIPNAEEVHGNITNIHWFLSIYLFLIIISDEIKSSWWKIHDFIVLIISGLSGPFIIFLLPTLIIKKYILYKGIKKFDFTHWDITFILIVMIQLIAILSIDSSDRSVAPLQANFLLFCRIIVEKIILGTFLPTHDTYAFILESNVFVYLMMIVTFICLLLIAIKASWKFYSGFLFVVLMLSAALMRPMISLVDPQWPALLQPGVGERYFIITNLFFFSSILYGFYKLDEKIHCQYSTFIRSVIGILIGVIIYGSFSIAPLPNTNYRESIKTLYNTVPIGSEVKIPINPNGWYMTIIKK